MAYVRRASRPFLRFRLPAFTLLLRNDHSCFSTVYPRLPGIQALKLTGESPSPPPVVGMPE